MGWVKNTRHNLIFPMYTFVPEVVYFYLTIDLEKSFIISFQLYLVGNFIIILINYGKIIKIQEYQHQAGKQKLYSKFCIRKLFMGTPRSPK